MIELTGLTKRQVEIAHILWATETKEEVDLFCRVNAEFETVRQLMVASVFDSVTDTDIANEVLQRIMEK